MEEIGGYRLIRQVGSGGMGTVWEAVDAGDQRVAIKLMHPHISKDPNARARLEREVHLLRRVRGPGIARVLDAEVEASEAFVVTQLIDGPTLEKDVDERGPFSPRELAALAQGLANALGSIHAAGVVHRDLKPSNVMMSATGPVIIDFGIAQIADDVRLTQTGMVTGTPGYLDPEIIDGADPSPACDWWAWAAVLVFAATGRQPFGTGPNAAVFHRMHTGEVDVEGLDDATAAAFRGALRPSSGARLGPGAVAAVLDGRWDRATLTGALGSLGLDADGRPRVAATVVVAPPQTPPASPSPPVAANAGPSGTAVWPESGVRPAPAPQYSRDAGATAVVRPAPPSSSRGYAPQGAYPDAYRAPGGYPAPRPPSSPNPYGTSPSGHYPAAGDHAAHDPYATPGGLQAPGDGGEVPRWLRPAPARGGLVASVGLLLAAVAAAWPGPALIIFAVLVIAMASYGFGARSLRETRLRRGVRRGDLVRAIAASPWHLLRGALLGVVVLALGLGVGWLLTQGAYLVLPGFLPVSDQAFERIVTSVGVWLVFLVTWFAPGAGVVREGTREFLGAVFPGRTMRTVVVLVCVVLVAAILIAVATGALGAISWSPLPQPVWLV